MTQGTVDTEFVLAVRNQADFIIALCEDKIAQCASFSTMASECRSLIELMEEFKTKKYEMSKL